jgi:phytoene/squalene synthetase
VQSAPKATEFDFPRYLISILPDAPASLNKPESKAFGGRPPSGPTIEVGKNTLMDENLAASITKTASQQTYYTIRFLVDRERVDDAYRSYAYFRWVDDVLDSDLDSRTDPKAGAAQRKAFLERQISLLECCYRRRTPHDVCPQEQMLVELVGRDAETESGLQSYLRNMMRVMEFDVERRGRWITQAELDEYTRWLAVAVTENLHHFIGHNGFAPRDESRYLAVSAAHIAHMIRDTYDDVRSGYFNIPREVLEAHSIRPQDVDSAAYRAWVKSRANLARRYFSAGKDYFRQIQNRRHRLAGFAYMARFEWLLETIEREGYALRPRYRERKTLGTGIRMGWLTLSSLVGGNGAGSVPFPVASQREGKA